MPQTRKQAMERMSVRCSAIDVSRDEAVSVVFRSTARVVAQELLSLVLRYPLLTVHCQPKSMRRIRRSSPRSSVRKRRALLIWLVWSGTCSGAFFAEYKLTEHP
jgi:hypothetical protein